MRPEEKSESSKVSPPLCVIPVYLPSSDGAFRHHGSATAIAFKGCFFLATAAHVNDGDGAFDELLIFTSRDSSSLFSLSADSLSSLMPASGSRDDDPYDIAVILLPSERAVELAGLGITFIGCDGLYMPDVKPGDCLLFVGYPNDPQKLCHLSDGTFIEQQPVSVRVFQTSDEEALALSQLGFSRESHLVARFRHPETFRAQEAGDAPLIPSGMSGGAVWHHTEQHIAFAGLVTKWHQGGHLIATRTQWLMRMLEAVWMRHTTKPGG